MRNIHTLLFALCALSIGFGGLAYAEHHEGGNHQRTSSDHNAKFKSANLDVEKWQARLEDPNRDVIANKQAIVDAMKLKPGAYVADVGAGTGPYIDPVLKAIGKDGYYYAADIAPAFGGFMRDMVDEKGYENVSVIVSQFDSATLPPNAVDTVFVIDTYHHFDQYNAMLKSMHKALKQGGELIIVDFDRHDAAREWVRTHIRASKEVFREEIKAKGFAFIEEVKIDSLKENFFFRFKKL